MNEQFKINVNKLNASEKLLSLIRITHPNLNTPLCMVSDNQKFIFEGQEYMPFPFSVKPMSQIESELPQATVIIPNFSSQIIKWVDSTMGARNAKFELIGARRSSIEPDYKIALNVSSVMVDYKQIVFKLNIQNNLNKRSIRWTYDSQHAIGLF